MKKKNLAILLIFPFLLSLLCTVTVNTTYNKIDVDISYIEWNYHDMEGFQITDGGYLLEAIGVNQRYYKVSGDGSLVWTVENKDSTMTEPCAQIKVTNGKHYLQALREGEVIITCSNQKGNVYRKMTGVIYKDAAILLYPQIESSQTNIDSTIYYGQYDHKIGTPASIAMTLFVVPTSSMEDMVIECSDNIRFDKENSVIDIVGPGSAELNISLASGLAAPRSFTFEVVKDGVNVYNYDDLMYCTNRSEKGEIAVLRKSFESVYNAYLLDSDGNPLKRDGNYVTRANNVECFGVYDSKTKKFDFSGDIYRFATTYNRNFIDQWNEFVKTDSNYSPITDQINVGLRVQKDFYGNGFTLNLHNLVYPYAYVPMTLESGETVRIPQLTAENIFRGPLTMYALGDPNNLPLMKIYGQDNVGMYVEGNGITVNDINLKNCEFGDRLANLATTGTVLEVAGNDVTVKNSLISNGKNVMRSFSSMNLRVENCMLSNAQNFLFLTGSNEYVEVDREAVSTFYDRDFNVKDATLSEFLTRDGDGDRVINDFLVKTYNSSESREAMRTRLLAIQNALNDADKVRDKFKGSTEIVDCYFYQSGISSICMESLFNSPFIEAASPSIVAEVLPMIEEGKSLLPYTPTHVSGTSYPVKLNISGSTRFYDYKKVEDIDLGGLIEENITSIVNDVLFSGENDTKLDIDTVFPLKKILKQRATSLGSVLTDKETGDSYINLPVTYYGGGLNMSEVTLDGYDSLSAVSGKTDVDVLNTYLNLAPGTELTKGAMLKIVTTVTGFEPFNFRFTTNGSWYGETPKATDLVANTKGD